MNKLAGLGVGLLVLSTILFGVGCGSSNARVRMLNASPGEASLDMLVDSKDVASGVAYGTASGYSSVSSGSRNLQIEATGTTTPLVNQTTTLGSNTDSTVLAINSAPSTAATVLTDNNSAPSSGNLTMRVINAAPSLGTADVYIVAPGTPLTSVSPTVAGLAFGSASAYQTLAAGSYEIFFTAAGQKFAAIDSGSLSFNAGQVRTIVGLNGQSGGFTAVVIADVN